MEKQVTSDYSTLTDRELVMDGSNGALIEMLRRIRVAIEKKRKA